jgi:rare lipoprotein A
MSRFRFPLLLLLSLLAGCGHKETRSHVPPPPHIQPGPEPSKSAVKQSIPNPPAPLPPIAPDAKPIYSQVGLASWYGPPYHNRRGSNGEIYDMNQMTAAHRTLPLNSIVRVTNVKTGTSALVRITDRGPFIGERMLDLSLAAAKAVDVWTAGTAWVRMDVLRTPAPIDTGGRWTVQIGAFNNLRAATDLKKELMERYSSAKILEFAGPTGEWVRIRIPHDDRAQAEEISRSVVTPEGGVFLVRLD